MPTAAEALVANSCRWGEGDERGTLNLLTPERARHVAGWVRRGKVYDLVIA